MVNDLRTLLRENVAHPPADHLDLAGVLGAGRRRVRVRRTVAGTGAAALVAVAATALLTGVAVPDGGDRVVSPAGVPRPDAPTVHLAGAREAVEGRDYRQLASYTNEDLNRDNGQYFDGVTDDGLVLFRDGPRMDQLRPRFALLDPATGAKDWLPDLRIGQTQTWPVALDRQRLVLAGATGRDGSTLTAYVFDRGTRSWGEVRWPSLPDVGFPGAARMGPDGRLYVGVPATTGRAPAGGWPTGADGEADDAGARGDTYRLMSLSLDDGTDVRDEGLRFGDLAFTPSSMVWTDSTNGAAGRVHVRDLRTGAEHAFDPHAGERCNLLSFGAGAGQVVMGEYCGTYGGERDDRVQVVSTDGDQVATLQGDSIEGALAGNGGPGDVVVVTSREPGREGTYAWDPADGSDGGLLRLSTQASQWSMGGPVPDGRLLWTSPANHGNGATQHLGELLR